MNYICIAYWSASIITAMIGFRLLRQEVRDDPGIIAREGRYFLGMMVLLVLAAAAAWPLAMIASTPYVLGRIAEKVIR